MGFSSQCKWRKRRSVGLMRDLLVHEVFVLQDEMHLSSCGRSLQLLAVQHLFLKLLDGLSEGSSATREKKLKCEFLNEGRISHCEEPKTFMQGQQVC